MFIHIQAVSVTQLELVCKWQIGGLKMFSNGEKMENLANASVHKQGSNYSDDMFAWK